VQPLREEIEAVIQEQGWSKTSVAKMTKLVFPSTLRIMESTVLMTRKTMKDFTFSDGTTIPAGNLLSVANNSMYPYGPGKEAEPQSKYSSPSISIIYCSVTAVMRGMHIFSWSLAKADDYHIYCSPGRFFAANELKAMLYHILLNYDVKMADGGGRPDDMWFGRSVLPDTKAEVLFRKQV
jgi:hypothetical protein